MRKLVVLVALALTTATATFAATKIIGTIPSSSTEDRLYYFIKQNNASFDREIAKQFLAVGKVYGVRGDIAICQSIIETGWFRFNDGTAVTPDQHNYCGLGVTSTGMKGNSFSTIKEGVTAQIQHLYAYACTADLPAGETLVDPRFKYVTRGCATTWESLGGKWASASTYGTKILQVYNQMAAFTIPTIPTITPSAKSLSFSAAPGSSTKQTITITPENLTGDIKATLSGTGKSSFYLSVTTLTKSGGKITVTFKPTAYGTHNATITLTSSGAEAVIIALSGHGEQYSLTKTATKVSGLIASADGRFSTGYGDYIYMTNKATGNIMSYDKSGTATTYATVEGAGTAITSDDAGNLLVGKNFSAATSSTSWVIINAQTKAQTPVAFSGFTAARLDQVGRVVGDMTSSAGAYVYLTPNGQNKIVAVKIANSQFVSATLSPATSLSSFNTSTIAQPMYATIATIEGLDNTAASAYLRQRTDRNIYSWSGTSPKSLGAPDGATNGDGFDVFKIDGVKYAVEPVSSNASYPYADGFVVRNLSTKEVVATKVNTISPSTQRFQSFTARLNDDGVSVTIYQSVSGEMLGFYTFTDHAATVKPTFSVAAGTYNATQKVSLYCPTDGATIYYTTDGTKPSTSSTKYTGQITVSTTTTIKALAVNGEKSSLVATAKYVINQPPSAPTFSLRAGTYNSPQSVEITCDTSGATIYYTTDGSTPSSLSAAYSSPIVIDKSVTIKAIAYKNTLTSPVTTATYTILIPPTAPLVSPAGGSFSNPQQVTLNCPTEGAAIHYTLDDTTPTENSPLYSEPFTIGTDTTVKVIAVKDGLVYDVTSASFMFINGVDDIDGDDAEIVDVQIYSMQGCRLTAAPKGQHVIIVTRRSDGSVSAIKTQAR